MNAIPALVLGFISEAIGIARRHEAGEIDGAEAARLLREATQRWQAQLDGFTLGLAADDKTIKDRLAKLRTEFPPPATSPPATPAPTGPETTGGG